MIEKAGISIFFPIYNDWGTVASMVISAINTVEKISDNYEIVLIDDGSEKRTVEILDFLEKKFEQVRVVHHKFNRGYGAALRTGFSECKNDLIFYTDGDAQYDVRELLRLIPHMTEDVDIVNGYKIKRADPYHRVVIGKIYHHIARWMFDLPIRDVDCDFRLMRRSIFEKVRLESDSGVICVEMIKKIHDGGFKFAEVPVHHYFRASGKSQFFNFKRIFKAGIKLITLWWKLVILKKSRR